MEKWDTLRAWLQIHASLETDLNSRIILEYMDNLEEEEKRFREQLSKPVKKDSESFLFTGVPSFDQKSFEQILEEKGLQGLA